MTVTLQPITKDNWRAVYFLTESLSPEQQGFVAPNGYSMLEALWDADKFAARAIYADVQGEEKPVGLLMTAYDPETQRHWVVRLMLGAKYQRKGYGRAAMHSVIDEYKAKPDCDALFISFEPHNDVARALYASLGFLDTGKIEYEECVYRLPLRESTSP